MDASSPAPISISCPCGSKLKVPATAIGKKGKCPKCGDVFVITAPPPPVPKKKKPEPDIYSIAEDDTGGGLLDELARMEKSAPKVELPKPVGATTPCPRCNQAMPLASKLCTGCGYNTETGRVVKGASAKASKVSALARKTGRLMTGVMLSAAGALVGAAIWFGITIASDYELGLIAWLVGLLSGYGMLWGYGQTSSKGGVVAAINAVVGILFAKLAIVAYVIYAMTTASSDRPAIQRATVAAAITEEKLEQKGIHDEADRLREWEGLYKESLLEVARMDDETVKLRHDALRVQVARDSAWESDQGRSVWQVAFHETNKRVEKEELRPGDDERENISNQEFARASQLSPEDLKKALQAKEAWEKEGYWSDQEYVRTHLIYEQASKDYYEKLPKEDTREAKAALPAIWSEALTRAKARVEPMTHDERVAALKADESKSEIAGLRYELTEHMVERKTLVAGNESQEYDYDEIWTTEEKRVEALTPDQVRAELQPVETWYEKGRWEDAEHVHHLLVSTLISEAGENRCAALQEKNPDADCELPPEDWQRIRDNAVAQASGLPAREHRKAIEESEARSRKRWEQVIAQRQSEDQAATGEAAIGFFAAFGATLLTPFNLICAFFAVATAFKVGSSGTTASD